MPDWLKNLIMPALGVLVLAGIYSVLDIRHEPRGAVLKSDLREIRREIRKLEGYERLAPNSEYSASRQAEIAALRDEEKELEMELR